MSDKNKVFYDCPDSCNKCGSMNNKTEVWPLSVESGGETKTKCEDCGFEDSWNYGYFASSEDGFNASKKYSFDN